MKLFSSFAAAELLERDRQTLTRALRNTPPDGHQRGVPRWKMSTIVRALEKHSPVSGGGTGNDIDPALAGMFGKFDAAYDAMAALSTLTKRRAAAGALLPMIKGIDQRLRAHGRAVGVGNELADLRADKLYQLTLRGFEGPCAWSLDETHANLSI
jgi:hypothetical protein